mgnify:CR=1 FL=1
MIKKNNNIKIFNICKINEINKLVIPKYKKKKKKIRINFFFFSLMPTLNLFITEKEYIKLKRAKPDLC